MRVETDKIRQTARFINLGYSQREISKQVKIHRSSIKIIHEKLMLFPIQNDELKLFTDNELLEFLEISRQSNYPTRKIYPDFEYVNLELKKKRYDFRTTLARVRCTICQWAFIFSLL